MQREKSTIISKQSSKSDYHLATSVTCGLEQMSITACNWSVLIVITVILETFIGILIFVGGASYEN